MKKVFYHTRTLIKRHIKRLSRMSKQRIINNGANIRNGNMIGGTGGIKPVDGSWTQGVEAVRTQDVRAKMAAHQETQKSTTTVKPTTPSQKGPQP